MSSPESYTKIKIISLALNYLGKGPINSIAGSGEFAEAAEDVYNLLFPSLITDGSWRFAAKTQELSLLTGVTPQISSWSYAWQLPADYLEAIRLDPSVDYMIYASKQLYANTNSSLVLEYYYQPEEESLPPYFVRFFAYYLASDMAYAIARDKTLAKVYDEKAKIAFAQGQAADAASHPNVSIRKIRYISARGTGRWGTVSSV